MFLKTWLSWEKTTSIAKTQLPVITTHCGGNAPELRAAGRLRYNTTCRKQEKKEK